MNSAERPEAHLLAISDLHVEHRENQDVVKGLRPKSPHDWLIVAGDVANSLPAFRWALDQITANFDTVIWVPGNHELHSYPGEDECLRGVRRYEHLVEVCRSFGVITPEDPYPVWVGSDGAVRVVPLFLLYDYSFGSAIAPTKGGALERAYAAGVVCDDEFVLHPDPYRTREDWCAARVEYSARRLLDVQPACPTVLVNHFPLRQEDTAVLARPEFAQWCGTKHTDDWHTRFHAAAVVYGHLHIPRTTWQDGTPFEEVSLGYPRERRFRLGHDPLRQVLPR